MGREVFDRLFEALKEANGRKRSALYSRISSFLTDQAEIRMYVEESLNLGHHSSTLHVMWTLIKLGFTEGKITIVCSNINVINALSTILPIIEPTKEDQELQLITGVKLRVVSYDCFNEGDNETISLGITGGFDNEGVEALTNPPLQLCVRHFIALQPYRWDYLDGPGYSQIQWAENEDPREPPINIDLNDSDRNFIERAYFYDRPALTEADIRELEKNIPDKYNAVKTCIDLSEKQAINMGVIYYGMVDAQMRIKCLPHEALINYSSAIIESKTGKDKQNVIISFLDICQEHYNALDEELANPNDGKFKSYCIAHNLKNKIHYLLNPTEATVTSAIARSTRGTVLIIQVGAVPQSLFNYAFSKSTLPPVFEGQGTANLALSCGLPYLQIGRDKVVSNIKSIYPSLGFHKEFKPYSNTNINSIVMQTVANYICTNLHSPKWDGYNIEVLSDFMVKAYDGKSIYYNYFKDISEYYLKEDNDKLIEAFNIYFSLDSHLPRKLNRDNLLKDLSASVIENLNSRITENIHEKSIEITSENLKLGNIADFYKKWTNKFVISDVKVELSEDKKKLVVVGVSDNFGANPPRVKMVFTAPDEKLLVSDLTVSLTDLTLQPAGIDWFSIEGPEINIEVGEGTSPVSGTISGVVPIGIELHLSLQFPLTGGQWILKGEFEKEKPSIAYFTQLVGGVNLVNLLPQPFSTFADLGVQSIDMAFNKDAEKVDFIVIDIGTNPENKWQILPGLQVADLGLTCTVNNPGSPEKQASYFIQGHFCIGKVHKNKILLTATVPDFKASATLQEGSILIGDLLTMFWSDVTLDLKSEISSFNLDIEPTNKNYSLNCSIKSDWTFLSLPNPKLDFTLTGLALDISGQQGATSGKLSGSFHIGAENSNTGVDIKLTAGYAQKAWTFEGSTGKDQKIPLTEIANTFLKPFNIGEIPSWVNNNGFVLDISNFTFKAIIPDKTEGKGNTYNIGGKVYWQLNFADFHLSLAATIDISYSKNKATGKITSNTKLMGLNFEIGYQFGDKATNLYLQWEGIRAEYASEKQLYTLHIIEMSVGDIIQKLMAAIIPNFELPAPWNVLNNVKFKDFLLSIDQKNKKITITHKIDLDFGFIKISQINLTKDADGVFLSFDGSFLGIKISEDNEATRAIAGKGSKVQELPTVPGKGEMFDLQLLVMGQHVGLAETSTFNSVDEAMQKLEEVFTDPNDKPNSIPISAAGGGMIFKQNSNWLIGADFTVAQFYRLAFIFNDPDLYGLTIGVSDKAKFLKNLQFSILYKKVSDTIGVYQTELQLPDIFRHLEFGSVSVTLPNIGIQVYTNGNFYLDFGWPASISDFSRSFTLELFPFIGAGGFYFASLTGATATNLPVVNRGTFAPVIEAGLALSVGLGKTINGGIFKAELYLSAIGMFEGTYAVFTPFSDSKKYAGQTDVYYRFSGTIALVGKISCEINFVIISASLEAVAYIMASIVVESYKAIPIYFEAGISVRLRVTVNLWLFKIRLNLSFSTKISASFLIGTDKTQDSLWYKVDHNGDLVLNDSYLLSAGNELVSLKWQPIYVDKEDVLLLNLYFIPHLTVAEDPNGGIGQKHPQYVGMLYLNNAESKCSDQVCGMSALMTGCLYWAAGAILGTEKDSITLDWLKEEIITAKNLADLLECMEPLNGLTPFNYKDASGNDIYNFLKLFFHVSITSPNEDSKEEISASVFPIMPDLIMKRTLNGVEETVDFSKDPQYIDYDYIHKVHELLKQMKVSSENTIVDRFYSSGKRANIIEDSCEMLAKQTLATFVFTDFVALVIKQLLQKALDLLKETGEISVKVKDLVKGVVVQENIQQIGGMASRFLLHGLRLPIPPGNMPNVTAPLYVLTGQQWTIPELQNEKEYDYTISLESKEIDWLSVGEGGEILRIVIDDNLRDRNERIARLAFEPSVRENYPKAITNKKIIPQSFSLSNNTSWDYPGLLFENAETVPYLWKLPVGFRAALKEFEAEDRGGFETQIPQFNLLTITRTEKSTLKGKVQNWKWVTSLAVKIRKIASQTKTTIPLTDYVYELIGVDDASTHVLEELLAHLKEPGGSSIIEQIRILMQSDPFSGKVGFSSAEDGMLETAIIKVNMSTETHPETNAIMHESFGRNTLNTPEEFITFLWECSVVRSGGFYFYYMNRDEKGGLPEYLFDKEGMASVQVVLTYKDVIPGIFLNGVVTGDKMDFSETTVYAQSENITLAVPMISQGCVGYELSRNNPGDFNPTSVSPTEDEDKIYLQNQYNLLGVVLPDFADYHNYTPAGPVDPLDGEGSKDNDNDNEPLSTWDYCAVIPYYKLKARKGYDTEYPNPYLGIGDDVNMELRWQDMFGNVLVDNPKTRAVSMKVLYTDTIIGISQWPSVACSYLFKSMEDTPCLNLVISFDSSHYNDGSENARNSAMTDLRTYMTLLYQLKSGDMSIKILSTIEGEEINPEGFKKNLDKNNLIGNFILPIIEYLKSVVLGRISDLPKSPYIVYESVDKNSIACYSSTLPLYVRILMSRDISKVAPDFMKTPGVAENATIVRPFYREEEDGTLNIAYFAKEFETAFTDKPTEGILIKIATSSENLGEGKDIWMVRFDSAGKSGIRYMYDSSKAYFFSPRPLSTSLLSFSAQISVYQSGKEYPAAETLRKTFSSVDMDVWGKQFLEAVDLFLAPEFAVPAFLLDNGKTLSEIISIKEQIADAIAGTVDYIIIPKEISSSCYANAREKWRQEILKELSAVYKYTAAVQTPVTIDSSWDLPNTEKELNTNVTPKLYGKMAGQTADYRGRNGEVSEEYNLSTSKLPLGRGKSWLTYMFECKDTAEFRNFKFSDMHFEVSHLEQDIKTVGIGQYTSSKWLTFVLPFDKQSGEIGEMTIPVPLRAYPVAPSVVSQDASYDEGKGTLQDSLLWNFSFTYKNALAAQDTIGLQVVLNTPGDRQDCFSANSVPDLKQALGQFVECYPQLSADFNTYLMQGTDDTKEEARNAVNAFKCMVEQVAIAWKYWNQVESEYSENAMCLKDINKPIILNYTVIETENKNTGHLNIQIVADERNSLELIPKINILGYIPVELFNDDKRWHIYEYISIETKEALLYSDRNKDSLRTASISNMSILNIQNAWGGVQLVRNEELLPDNEGYWQKTNEYFLYQTPMVMFYTKHIPFRYDNVVIDITEMGVNNGCAEQISPLERSLQALFSSLCKDIELFSKLSIKLNTDYVYKVSGTDYSVTVPILLTYPIDLDIKKGDQLICKLLARKLERKLLESGLPDGQLNFELDIFSLLDSDVPILKMKFIFKVKREPLPISYP